VTHLIMKMIMVEPGTGLNIGTGKQIAVMTARVMIIKMGLKMTPITEIVFTILLYPDFLKEYKVGERILFTCVVSLLQPHPVN